MIDRPLSNKHKKYFKTYDSTKIGGLYYINKNLTIIIRFIHVLYLQFIGLFVLLLSFIGKPVSPKNYWLSILTSSILVSLLHRFKSSASIHPISLSIFCSISFLFLLVIIRVTKPETGYNCATVDFNRTTYTSWIFIKITHNFNILTSILPKAIPKANIIMVVIIDNRIIFMVCCSL